jgi:hypothetical protein
MKSEDKCMLRNDYVGRLSTHAVSVTFILHNNPVDCVVANRKYQRKKYPEIMAQCLRTERLLRVGASFPKSASAVGML